MSKLELKAKALKLRARGMSYNQIKLSIKVSKSTLSLWLREYPLKPEQMRLLRDFSEVRIEKFRQTMLGKREKRFEGIYKEEKAKQLPLSERELFIAGLFLYWGEGTKDLRYPLALYNTNPQIIKFGLGWYVKGLKLPLSKINIQLHLYSDMNIREEMKYWSKELKVPLSQFPKPYIKKSKKSDINRKGSFGHGTCGWVVHDVRLKERVMAAIKAIADHYGNRI